MSAVDTSRITPALRRTLLAMHAGDAWLTLAEMPDGATGMGLTLLCVGSPALAERRRTRWGGEPGQKPGAGYEYRLTPTGRDARQALEAAARS